MLTFSLLTALAAEPASLVAGLFPTAKQVTIAGKPALAPIRRKGQTGWIALDSISTVPMADGRSLVAFRLETADLPDSVDAVEQAVSSGHSSWNRVLGVVLLGADGAFIAKPPGYPLEKQVQLDCMGDFCDFGPRGRLHPVNDSTRYAVLELDAQPESMGAMVPIRVQGDTLQLMKSREHGSAGGLTGCAHSQIWSGFREKDGQLKAVRVRSCGDGDEDRCKQLCDEAGYPTIQTGGPFTLDE